MDSILSEKNFSRDKKEFKKVSSRRKSRKSFIQTIHWNLSNSVKIFHGNIVLPHLIDLRRMGLPKERYEECKKGRLLYCCNQAWMKNGGPILWNVTAICEKFKISCLMGRHLGKGGSGYHLKAQCFVVGQWLNITLFLLKTSQESIHQFGKKVLPGLFLGYALYAGRIWKGDKMVADVEELVTMDASEICPRRSNAKEVFDATKGGNIIFPVADGTAKLSGRDHEFREPTLNREQPLRSGELQGEPEGFQPTETKDDGEAWKDFWSIPGDFIYLRHIEPRVRPHVPKEETFLVPLKHIDVTKATYKSGGVARKTYG